MKASPACLRNSEVWDQLKGFVAEKRMLAEAICAEEGKEMLPEFRAVFDAAEKGDLPTIDKTLDYLRWLSPGADHRDLSKYCLRSQWAIALEVWGTFQEFSDGGEKYMVAFGRDVIASIPPGGIYFGGTDAGRFVVTALCESHVKAVPFFTLTQCALADKGYLRYVQSIYGERIHIPTEEECTATYDAYVQDALQRQKENQLKPGEFPLKEVDGKFEIQGITGVMAINGALSKWMFDKNPDRDFYVEESFPLEWMYPHLTPHGLVMKVNREPSEELAVEVVRRDREFWTRYAAPMLGDWLTCETPVAELAGLVEKVYLNKDLSGFGGDPEWLPSPKKAFSKLRSSIGGLYVWRMMNAKSANEKDSMAREADFAFRQAWALNPCSPEAVFRYVNLLIPQQRFDEAILIAESAEKLKPADVNFRNIAIQLRRMKSAASHTA